jgi:dTMP kinase
MPDQGRFIVFEGLDCSGSTTQANLLYQRLMRERRRVWITSEPSSGPVGHLIRLFFSGRVILPEDPIIRDRQFAYLFAADRFDHLYNPTVGILKFLREGIDVISTRYVLSSLAYNVESTEDEPLIRGLNAGFPNPDYLIYLDCPVSVSVERMSVSRPNRDTYENRTHLTRAAANYENALSRYTSPLLRIDARLPKKQISKEVFKFISERDTYIGHSNSTLSEQTQTAKT